MLDKFFLRHTLFLTMSSETDSGSSVCSKCAQSHRPGSQPDGEAEQRIKAEPEPELQPNRDLGWGLDNVTAAPSSCPHDRLLPKWRQKRSCYQGGALTE